MTAADGAQAYRLADPDDFNFAFDVVGRRAREDDKLAIVAVDRAGEQVERLSYADLDRASNRFANVLTGLGVARGDFAFVMIPRIPAWFDVLLGCMKAGVVAMPGTNLLTAKDIAYRINRSGARLAIVTPQHVGKVEAIRAGCPTLEHLIVVGDDAPPGWVSMSAACAAAADTIDRARLPPTRGSDPMLIYFTSGTTSMPKMVERDHAYGLAHAITGQHWMGLREDDLHWTLTDTGWAKAAWGMMFPQFLAGAAILLYDGEGFDAAMHLRLIEQHRVTTFCAPPTIYRMFAQTDLSGYDLGSLRHCMGAGEPLNPEAMRAWKRSTGCDIYDGYGQTETVCIVANRPGMAIRPGSMGKPNPGLDIDIVDEDGAIVADDTVGNIAVRITDPWPPGLFRGYFDDDGSTAAAFRNGWYFTGDTATRDADGYIWFVGRADDIISSAGYRISPFEVESALVEHPAVAESAVVGKPDPLRGEIVKAYVILAAGHTPSDALTREIQDFVKHQTAPYKYPREIEYRSELPKTISGKIRRVELRAEARSATQAKTATGRQQGDATMDELKPIDDPQCRTEVRDGMRIDWDVPITMDDGLVLRANVYRPLGAGRYPAIMNYGPYAKDLAWQEGYAAAWNMFSNDYPEAIAGSSNVHQSWEVHDPEKWVPDGYVMVRVDSRGAGRSPGVIDCFSPREAKDYAACIDWAGTQDWSNGKVGLAGISYYAINQWHVAGLQPKHLAAMCVWEGAADFYRDMAYHGGILTPWLGIWYDVQVKSVQHGVGTRGARSRVTGEPVAGPETLADAALQKNRVDFGGEVARHPLDDSFHRARSADWSKVTVPFLSAASWGGQGLHPRGNYMGFLHAASKQKWLECHGLEHWTEFYTPYGLGLQKQFFGHFLKGEKNGWNRKPPVLLKVRHVGETFVERAEKEWPLARTKWTRRYLDPQHLSLAAKAPERGGKVTYDGMGEGVTFFLPAADEDVEITGPLAAKLFVSSTTADADLFLTVRLFSPDMKEVTFKGTVDPHTPIAQGWLRASHRKLDKKLSKPWQPWHTHDEKQPLTPGRIYELDVEIWPTCIVVPAGYRLALSVRGKDYEWAGATNQVVLPGYPPFNGCGVFIHTDPKDRPARVFGGKVTLHCGPKHKSHLLLPVIPAKSAGRKKK